MDKSEIASFKAKVKRVVGKSGYRWDKQLTQATYEHDPVKEFLFERFLEEHGEDAFNVGAEFVAGYIVGAHQFGGEEIKKKLKLRAKEAN